MSFSIFLGVLLSLQMMVIVEGYCAWRKKLLRRGQGRKARFGNKIGYFIEHVGMWGDFCLISPLIALLIALYSNTWGILSIINSIAIGLVLGVVMFVKWCADSYRIEETFAENGRLTFAGLVHGFYTIVAITVILLYYFATPHNLARGQILTLTTGALSLHISLGILVPKLVTDGKVERDDIVTVSFCWIALAVGYTYILH